MGLYHEVNIRKHAKLIKSGILRMKFQETSEILSSNAVINKELK